MSAWETMMAAVVIPSVTGCDGCGRSIHGVRPHRGARLCRRCRHAEQGQ